MPLKCPFPRLRLPSLFADFELPLGRRARVLRTGRSSRSYLHGRVGQSLGFILRRSAPRAVHYRASSNLARV